MIKTQTPAAQHWLCTGHVRLPWGMIAWTYADGTYGWQGFRYDTFEAVHAAALAYQGS